MKGSNRNEWRIAGINRSRKWHKKMWNRRMRHSNEVVSGCFYKRFANKSAYDGIS